MQQGTITTGTADVIYLCCLSSIHVATGALERARAVSARARELAETTRRPFDLLAVSLYDGGMHLVSGQVTRAIDVLERALKIARGSDIPVHIPFIARNLARAYAISGRLDEAEALLEEAMSYAESCGLGGMRILCGPALGLVRALRDEADAVACCEVLLDAALDRGMRPAAVQMLRMLGFAQARAGDLAAAEAAYGGAIELADALGMGPEAAQARGGLAAVLRERGREFEAGRTGAGRGAGAGGDGMGPDEWPGPTLA